ncbi:DNA-binding protein [Paenibacillus sp. GCM10027628]
MAHTKKAAEKSAAFCAPKTQGIRNKAWILTAQLHGMGLKAMDLLRRALAAKSLSFADHA